MIQQMHNEQTQASEVSAGLMRSSTLQSRTSTMTGITSMSSVGADGVRHRKRQSVHVLGAGGIGTVVTAWDGSTDIPDGHLHHLHNGSQHPHDHLNDVPSILLSPQMARVRSRSSSLSSVSRQGSVLKASPEAVVLVDQPAASPKAAAEPHQHGPPPFFTGLHMIVTSSKLNWLLLAVPPALFAPMFHNETLQFVLALVSILPLAGLLGDATEEFANYTSETMGGLVNATFGNAVELIIGIVALKAGLLRVVQASILGSILSNLLLVLGFAFLAAGIKYKSCEFNVTAAQTTTSLLFISCLGITVPAAFSLTNAAGTDSAILSVSRATGVMLFLVYIAYLVFQLKTHAHLYEDDVNANMELMQESSVSPAAAQAGAAPSGDLPMQGVANPAVLSSIQPVIAEAQHEHEEEEEEEEEESKLSLMGSIILLASVTVIVGVIAEWLVDSIDAVTKSWGMSETFVAIIILPIVGNAAEHATAVQVALAGRINLAIGVAVGSSVQIACGVFPFVLLLL
jgi:Ca2+:H+ antiporter